MAIHRDGKPVTLILADTVDVAVGLTEIKIDAGLVEHGIHAVEITLVGILGCLFVVHDADIREGCVEVGLVGLLQIVVIVEMTDIGDVDMDSSGIFVVELGCQLVEDGLIGIADDAPGIEIDLVIEFDVTILIDDDIALVIPGKIILDGRDI